MAKEDIENEIRAVLKVCEGHENIIRFLDHGTLRLSPNYFFDMELCEHNLDTYIKLLWTPSHLEKLLWACSEPIVDPKVRLRYTWVIMGQIANGVNFLHSKSEIHRDLKPRNGSLMSSMI